ncbi:DUF4344 domain-containing metallopeptidase [Roseibium sp. Sym1]|uniref:DUF4344 domain-containing metallopeptidase n=1 Tax=Roseibium sp. Sym1 TaxID=3016006 RepID=UPI0022B54272|nr:DUF4344 domain-containing metallopeptidase [Roseibium sp. Sym1]
MLKVFAQPSLIFALCTFIWAGTVSPALSATTTSGQDPAPPVALDQVITGLPQDDLEDLFVFVAGNVLFTLYHEGGHMLISELGLPVLAQEEDAVDNLATVTMLAADNDDMDLYLAQAMIGWFLIAEEAYEDLVFYDEHDLDQQRGYAILCLMVGADPSAFRGLARDLELPADRIESCGYDYEQAADSWDIVTSPHLRDADDPGGKIRVVHEPAPAGLDSMAVFLKESELMELVAEELDTFYDLPEEVTFRATTCNEENAFWDPDTRELILCHELLGGFAEIFLSLPDGDQDDE